MITAIVDVVTKGEGNRPNQFTIKKGGESLATKMPDPILKSIAALEEDGYVDRTTAEYEPVKKEQATTFNSRLNT